MQFIKEFKDLEVGSIIEYLQKSNASFAKSDVYDATAEEKVFNEEIRRSEFRLFADGDIMGLCDALLKQMSDEDQHNDYALVRSDVTHIRYKPGDFFSRHRDYLNLTSNIVEEYSLLVCVTPDSDVQPFGGETLLHVNSSFSHSSLATTTPGQALLFRKDIEHESAVLQAGAKEILAVNVWVMRKTIDSILLVAFKEPEATVMGSGGPLHQSLASMDNASNYAISTSVIKPLPNSFFSRHVNFHKRKREKIIQYLCHEASYKEFSVVYKVLTGAFVSQEEVSEGKHLLEFFGIPLSNLLVSMANQGNVMAAKGLILPDGDYVEADTPKGLGLGNEWCCKFCSRAHSQLPSPMDIVQCTGCSTASYCCRDCARKDWKNGHAQECKLPIFDPVADKQIIVCTSEERTAVLNATAKSLGLPYVPFKLIFAGEYSECGVYNICMCSVLCVYII
jgi:hypothetical protein